MGQLLILLAVALVAAALAWGIAVLLLGRDPGLEPAEPDGQAIPLPTVRPLTESDVSILRFDTTARGYRMFQVDQALRRVAYDLGYKEELIGVLEAEVAALREGRLADADTLRQAREAAQRPRTPQPVAVPAPYDLQDSAAPTPPSDAQDSVAPTPAMLAAAAALAAPAADGVGAGLAVAGPADDLEPEVPAPEIPAAEVAEPEVPAPAVLEAEAVDAEVSEAAAVDAEVSAAGVPRAGVPRAGVPRAGVPRAGVPEGAGTEALEAEDSEVEEQADGSDGSDVDDWVASGARNAAPASGARPADAEK